MEGYSTDEELVATIKKWWKENGTSLLLGAAIGLGGIFGWRAWTDMQTGKAEQASQAYEQMLAGLNKGDMIGASLQGESVISQFPGTPYAELSALLLAKVKILEKDTTAARAHLQWVMDNAKQEDLKLLARERLARVMVDAKEYDAALALIDQVQAGAFSAGYEDLRGDIALAKGDVATARESFDRALAAADENAATRRFIKMKRDDLGPAEERSVKQ